MEMYLQYSGMTKAKMMEELRPQAERQVKATLALEAIAKAEKFEASSEEIDAEFKRVADSYQIDVEKAKNWLSKGVQPTETVKSLLVKTGAMEKSAKLSPSKTKTKKSK